MHGREFCKLLAGAATAAALPALGQSADAAGAIAGVFDKYTENFPACAAIRHRGKTAMETVRDGLTRRIAEVPPCNGLCGGAESGLGVNVAAVR